MKKFVFLLSVAVSSPSAAYELVKTMAEPPEASYRSILPFYEIERCIMMQHLSSQPSVYRTPDKPAESLIHFGLMRASAIKLVQNSDSVDVTLWRGGHDLVGFVADCTKAAPVLERTKQ